MTEIVVDDYYDGGRVKIALDATLPPAKNAQRYYRLYTKQKRTVEMLTPRKKEVEETLDYLGSVYFAVESAEGNAETIEEIKKEAAPYLSQRKAVKKERTERPLSAPRCYEIDGFVVKAGKNNLQNEKLLKEADKTDVWLHVQKYHSAHVVVFTQGNAVSDKALLYAAEICAYYSQAREGDKIPVDYCPRGHVKKAPHAQAGRVYYNEYQTIIVTPNPHKDEEVAP